MVIGVRSAPFAKNEKPIMSWIFYIIFLLAIRSRNSLKSIQAVVCSNWKNCHDCTTGHSECVWCANPVDQLCVPGGFGGLKNTSDCKMPYDYSWNQCYFREWVAIVIIAAVCAVILISLALVLCFLCCRSKRRSPSPSSTVPSVVRVSPSKMPQERPSPWWKSLAFWKKDKPPAYGSDMIRNTDIRRTGTPSAAVVEANKVRDQVLSRLERSALSPPPSHTDNEKSSR